MLGHGSISESSISDFPVEILEVAIEGSLLPPDAKRVFIDFIKETYQDLWNTLEELVNLDPPIHLIEYWDMFVELVKQLL